MKIFLSYARKDVTLAHELTSQLRREGLTVWIQDEIDPRKNWAKETGKALDESEWILFLFAPGAIESDVLRQNLEFVLGSKKYEGRVFSVFVGPAKEMRKNLPWILRKLPNCQVESAGDFSEAVSQFSQNVLVST